MPDAPGGWIESINAAARAKIYPAPFILRHTLDIVAQDAVGCGVGTACRMFIGGVVDPVHTAAGCRHPQSAYRVDEEIEDAALRQSIGGAEGREAAASISHQASTGAEANPYVSCPVFTECR